MARTMFGPFEFDSQSGRLKKHGLRIKLQPKSAGVLTALLERPGETVTRQELQARLWPDGTFVDFDRSINVAVKRLRDALFDSTEEPTYIATVPGEGYRFTAAVTNLPESVADERTVSPGRRLPSGRRTLLWAGVAAGLILVLGTAMFFVHRRSAIQFHSRDWVLIADFDNRTGEKILDGTLEFALERELSNSQFVNVVPRERIQDALRLMKKPLDAKLDRSVAHEVCLRDGGIKAILTGRVEKIGTNYELTVQIVDPVRDLTVASYAAEDSADDLLARTVRKLSSRVREELGEQIETIRQSNDQLEKVTTPSLRALQLYTQAYRTWTRGTKSLDIAAQLLEEALKEDPEFASAHLLLGYVYSNQGKSAEAAPQFRRAFELADTTSEHERYFILANYYARPQVNQLEKASEIYETLLRRYPDDYWAVAALWGVYKRMGRSDKAVSLVVSVADLRPNDVPTNLLAAYQLISDKAHASNGQIDRKNLTESDFAQARHYLNRVSTLIVEQGGDDYNYGTFADSPRLLAAWADWLEGKLPQASTEILEVERRSKTLVPEATVGLHASLGELHAAEKRIATESWADKERLALAYYRGDLVECRTFLSTIHEIKPPYGADTIGIVAAHSGQWKQAQIARQTLLADRDHPLSLTWLHIVDGEIALAKGDRRRGIAVLEAALPKLDTDASSTYMALADLADAYQKEGKTEKALDVLQTAAAKSAAGLNFSFAWQMRIRLQLAQVYREIGRTQDAEKIESILKKELTIADPDHPILISLNRRQHAPLTRQ